MGMRRAAFGAAAGLAAFLAWQALALGSYIRAESRPPAWDQANHLEVARQYHHALREGRWADIWGYTPNGTMPPFPPLYHLGASFAYFTENPAGNALWLNGLYLALLALSLYAIALRLCRDRGKAVAAAAIFSCAPLLQGLLRTQLVDLPLAAMTALAYWALLRTEGFCDRRASLWFGAAVAAGLLHKWSFFTYLLPAFYLGWRALAKKASRGNALWALAVAAGAGLPWYLIRLPLVLVRLKQASSDFVIPVWEGGAFFHYALYLPGELGWPFCAAALYGLWSLRRDKRPEARLVLGWFLASYAFWAVVPNRQARFLLPGLAPLSVAAAAACPAPVVWGLAAWQAGASLIDPVARPAREDWKLDDILRAVDAPAFTAVSIIANDERFNKLGFIWRAGVLGLSNIQFRGVNDVPWELSPFVIFKTGRLGPESVVHEFEEARRDILDKNGWFARAFEEYRRWPLPDGSHAVLYRQRRLSFKPQRLRGPLYVSAKIEIPRAEILTDGRKTTITAPEASIRGIQVSGVRLELTDALLVPDRDGARLVRIGRLKVLSAETREADLRDYLDRPPLRLAGLKMDGVLAVAASALGLPFSAEISAAGACRLSLSRARLGAVPLPAGMIERWGVNGPVFAVEPSGDKTIIRTVFGLWRALPFPIELDGCSIAGGRMGIP